MLLSINLNKIALLRNSRGSNYPNLEKFAIQAIKEGAEGITLHPRPDHRHSTSDDVINLSNIVKSLGAEFNIEGNPFEPSSGKYLGLYELIKLTNPTQATLVPDTLDQVTSDHGWKSGEHDEELKVIINSLLSHTNRVSLFIDPDLDSVKYAKSVQANSIEIYTEEYAKTFLKDSDKTNTIVESYKHIIGFAKDNNLRVNAGHDLNLENLPLLRSLNLIDEVSIGHAVIIDSLKYGFKETINKYKNITKG